MDRVFISQAFGAVPVQYWAVLVWHLMQVHAWAGRLMAAGCALPRLAVRSDGVIVDAGAERLEDYWDSAHYQAGLRRWAAPVREAVASAPALPHAPQEASGWAARPCAARAAAALIRGGLVRSARCVRPHPAVRAELPLPQI